MRVSKREGIEALQQVSEFARKGAVAFADLRTRCQLLEAAIKHNTTDPLSEDQLKHFDKLMADWEEVAKDVLR